MKTLLSFSLLGTCLLFANRTSCHAQEFWKHFARPDLGVSVNLYRFSDPTAEDDEFNLLHAGPQIGLNIPIVYLAKDLCIGINPQLGVSLQPVGDNYSAYFDQASSSTLAIEAPAYTTLKFNTDASWKGSKSPVGLAAGIGMHYNAFFFFNSGVNAGYFQPSYLLEINFGSRSGKAGLFKLRWTSYIGDHEEEFEEFDRDLKLLIHQFAVNVLWVPGY